MDPVGPLSQADIVAAGLASLRLSINAADQVASAKHVRGLIIEDTASLGEILAMLAKAKANFNKVNERASSVAEDAARKVLSPKYPGSENYLLMAGSLFTIAQNRISAKIKIIEDYNS